MRTPWPLALAVVAFASVARAAGPDLDACLAAAKDGQTFKIRGQLSTARANLEMCADEACPRMIKQECMRWIEEVDRAMPTIVFAAHDAAGHDLVDVAVKLDGALLSSRLDGKAVPVDPGPHVLRFEAGGLLVRTEHIVAREGDKNRVVDVTLREEAAVVGPPVHEAPIRRSPVPWVLGGIGLVALAAGVGVGVASILYANGLHDGCGQTAAGCQQSDVDLGWGMYVFAGINDGLAGALILTSAIMLITHKAPARSAAFVVTPTLGGLSLGGTF